MFENIGFISIKWGWGICTYCGSIMKIKAYQYASEISVGRRRPTLIDNQLILLNSYTKVQPAEQNQKKNEKRYNYTNIYIQLL